MVKLFTNVPCFANDISDEIRLYLAMTEVVLTDNGIDDGESDAFVSVVLNESDNGFTAKASVRQFGAHGEYEYTWKERGKTELEEKRYAKRALKIAVFRAMKQVVICELPWGSLTGIRPTRLLRELYASYGETEAVRMMRDEFDVKKNKLNLAREIVAVQKGVLETQDKNDVDIYIGVPFCASRCLYCSFASEVRSKSTDMKPYIEALKKDIALGAQIIRESGRKVRAMYMGGGTPTVLTADELNDVLSCAVECYGGFGSEFTVEAGRPDTITREKLQVIHDMGAGRISINPQTMNQKTLALIGRNHTPEEIIRAYYDAREIGFDSINMDIICGLPDEYEDDMANTLENIVRLSPDNLTVHTLALKRSSRLVEKLEQYPLPDAHCVESMICMGMEAARMLSMRPYYMYRQKYMSGNLENVGYAKADKACVYNIDMMEDTTSIMAHGAGSMTKCIYDAQRRVERVPNPKDIATYIAKIEATAAQKRALFISDGRD